MREPGAWIGVLSVLPLLVGASSACGRTHATVDASPDRDAAAAELRHRQARFELTIAQDDGPAVPPERRLDRGWLLRAAEQGNAAAANDLGALYEWGEGAPQDTAQAVRWYRKAAEAGVAAAQNNLGRAYAQGLGVALDFKLARKWFEKAAAEGHPVALNNLAQIQGNGSGVRADDVEGLAWSYRAEARYAELGQVEPGYGREMRRAAEREMTSAQIAAARRRSGVPAPRPALEGQPEWIDNGTILLLSKIGLKPARDLEVRGNYHWRWRARFGLRFADFNCPAGTTVDVSRTINLLLSPNGSTCTIGARPVAKVKLSPEGFATPVP